MARSFFLILLVLAILISLNPQVQANISGTWESIRPAVVDAMDHVYAGIRKFVVGADSDHQIHENPITPGANFEVIIT